MIQEILFAITFIFGVFTPLTWTKIFDKQINGLFDVVYWAKTHVFFKWLDVIIFLLSLGYQSVYWLYR
jgi:hypothetical protein